MASDDPVWERFVACKLSQAPSSASQNSENNSILGGRSVNLLHADAGTAGLMRDLAVRPVEEILSGKASQELASRNRYVDYVRFVLCASGREKKAAVAVKALQVRAYRSLYSKRCLCTTCLCFVVLLCQVDALEDTADRHPP